MSQRIDFWTFEGLLFCFTKLLNTLTDRRRSVGDSLDHTQRNMVQISALWTRLTSSGCGWPEQRISNDSLLLAGHRSRGGRKALA